MRISVFTVFFLLSGLFVQGQAVNRIDPPHWFTGMMYDELQLLLVGEDLVDVEVAVNYPGVSVAKFNELSNNPNYAILYLKLEKTVEPGEIDVRITGKKKAKIKYELKRHSRYTPKRLSPADFIYLIMPDRFANGDAGNDVVADFHQNTIDRNDGFQRHGGDLQGITKHLDYLDELGVTSLWLNPVYENNQDHESYHGYAITDFYNVDARLGGNDAYRALVDAAHRKDMKVIKDVVYNHMGSRNYLAENPPAPDWIHGKGPGHADSEDYLKTSYRATTLFDPHSSYIDRDKFANGWFDKHMPDLNQENPDVEQYLIQQTIWWVAEFNIDALRVDTYAYPDQVFMRIWRDRLEEEFPSLFVFAETWVHGASVQSWFVGETELNKEFNNHLESVTDFQLYYAFNKTANEDFGWTEGVSSLYYVLAKDYLYPNPNSLVTFLDNHDLARYYGVVGEDFRKFKMGVGLLATLRGIPQWLYGTEILMSETKDHGAIREDMPGGWADDSVSVFTEAGRDSLQNEAFNYTKTLFNWRKRTKAVTEGRLLHFVPEDGVYVFFRDTEDEAVMVVVNASKAEKKLNNARFNEVLHEYPKAKEVTTQEEYSTLDEWTLQPYEIRILELSK